MFRQTAQFGETSTNEVRSTRVHVWWQFTASRPAIFHRGKSGEMVQKGSNHPRFGRAIRAYPTVAVSLSFSILVPFPDYSVSISRTGVYPTVHPTLFSPFSLDSTYDHPQIYFSSGGKPVLLPFIGHTIDQRRYTIQSTISIKLYTPFWFLSLTGGK